MTKIKFVTTLCLVAITFVLAVAPALAALDTGIDVIGPATGLGNKDLRTTIGSIINVALGFLGVVAVVIVLIGGFKYMVAGGNTEKATEARKWIISGIIGLAIILSAYAITSFVIGKLITATAGGSVTGE